ncbi:hypothetical protein [Ornithinibacillus bavariensis]|uniref:Membrane protein YszA n=1 Tax=Ornithinibacillus bavariensis TaxID=545502 RepID=A0A919XAV4_9BACI|nr:hypothetical protein [Ornithinibacillus bavariensis]GIO27690.1 putative membrane protein YszA [Ornithinibacillus bavariensis]HAM81437.1 hypothetical protein [Ornithinibacillus sp.]
MSRYYRYRLPPWALKCLIVVESVTLPILIFQLIRTIIFPTSFDVLLTLFLAFIFISFYLKWI